MKDKELIDKYLETNKITKCKNSYKDEPLKVGVLKALRKIELLKG